MIMLSNNVGNSFQQIIGQLSNIAVQKVKFGQDLAEQNSHRQDRTQLNHRPEWKMEHY